MREMLRALCHAIAHRFGWWSGRIETWRADLGWGEECYVGLRCGACGRLGEVHEYNPAALRLP